MRREGIEGAVDRQTLRQSSRPGQPLDPPNQNGRGMARWADDEIEHLVNSITKVDVPMPSRSVKHFCSGGSANPGVAGQVGFSIVGLHFGDDPPFDRAVRHPPGKHLAEQTLGQFDSIFCSPIPFGTGTCLFSSGE